MNHCQFCKLVLIVAVVVTALGTSLAGLAGLAQASPIPDSALVILATAPANLPLLDAGPFTVTKSSVNEGDTPLRPGERLTYTITIFNAGDQSATNVTISDTLPANTTFVPGSMVILPEGTSGTAGTQPILAEGITITASTSVTVTYAVTVNSNVAHNTQIINTASVTSTELPGPASATVTDTVVNEADLSISKTSNQTTVIPGTSVTYTIVVSNIGPGNAPGSIVTDTFPSTNDVSWTCAAVNGADCPASGSGNLNTTVDLPSGGLVTFIATGTVNAEATGSLVNTASAITPAGVSDPNSTNNSAVETDTLQPTANLSLSKSGSPDLVRVGDSLTYTLTISNAGPSVAANVVVTDTLPLTVNFSAAPGCNESNNVVTCGIATLNSGATETITIVVTPTIAGVLTNQAVVSSTASDPNAGNNQAGATTTVNPKADLVISKSDEPATVVAGETLTYTLTITNNGPSPATNVVISDTLPLSLSLQSVTPATSTQNGQQLNWNLDNMAVGTTQTFTIVAKVGGDVRNSVQNTATVTSTVFDPTPGNNSDTETTLVEAKTNLAVTKSDSPDPIGTGNPLIYIVQITNNGPSDALLVTLTDNLPATVSVALVSPSQGGCSGSSVIMCNLGKIDSGSGANVTLLVTPNSPGIITNTVTVASSETDPDPSNNTDVESTTVNPANLSVTKTASSNPVQVGKPLTYTLTVASAPGFFKADNVTLVDILPATVTLKSISINPPEQGSCSGTGTITCDLNEMFSGTNATVTIVVTPTQAGLITNTATITSDMPDPNPANNTTTISTVVDPVADLAIAKIASPDSVTAGTSLTYTLNITNNGPSGATGVVVTDTLPASVTFVSASPFCSSQPNNQVRCTYDSIASGSAASPAVIRVAVNPAAPSLITNTVTVTGTEFDSNTSNNTATITTAVNRLVNLSITKTGSSNPVAAGSGLNYLLTITNSGPSQASGVIVTDTLPAGVTFSTASPDCSNSSNKVTCNLGSVSSGGAITASINVIVASSTSGTLTNTATVTSSEPDSNAANNTVTTTTTITRVTDLAITQSSTPNPVTAGNNITYNLTVINNGPSDATSVTVSNTLPAEVTFQSVTPATCSHSGGVVTCNLGGMVNGSTAPIAIVANVSTSAAGNIINTAEVTVSGSSDPVPENNSTSAPAFVGGLSNLFLPLVLKPAPTSLFIENDTGGPVTFSVVEAGISCNVPASDQNFFCGTFPSGGYTVKVVSICGNLTTSKFYDSGPQSTRVFCK